MARPSLRHPAQSISTKSFSPLLLRHFFHSYSSTAKRYFNKKLTPNDTSIGNADVTMAEQPSSTNKTVYIRNGKTYVPSTKEDLVVLDKLPKDTGCTALDCLIADFFLKKIDAFPEVKGKIYGESDVFHRNFAGWREGIYGNNVAETSIAPRSRSRYPYHCH